MEKSSGNELVSILLKKQLHGKRAQATQIFPRTRGTGELLQRGRGPLRSIKVTGNSALEVVRADRALCELMCLGVLSEIQQSYLRKCRVDSDARIVAGFWVYKELGGCLLDFGFESIEANEIFHWAQLTIIRSK